MEEIKTDEIIDLGSYYSYHGELYIKQFPIAWAKSHAPETGPEECGNCSFYGSWNGVFIGYCANCAEHIYEYRRGHGFIEHGEELDLDIIPLRAMDTYLHGVKLDEIEYVPNIEFYTMSDSEEEEYKCSNSVHSNMGEYYDSEDSDDRGDRYSEKLKDHKKMNIRNHEYYTRSTPVSENSCSMCYIGK
jgi:hypothetical protein